MWVSIVQWCVNIPKMLGEVSLYFTLTLPEIANKMPWIPGVSNLIQFWGNIFPNLTLLGLIGSTGIIVLLVILMIKKVLPF